jgi:hypothetical protein
VSSDRVRTARAASVAERRGSTPGRRPQVLTNAPALAQTQRGRKSDGHWQIIDDLPRPTPIGRAEIETLEIYLGAQIDDILRRMRA